MSSSSCRSQAGVGTGPHSACLVYVSLRHLASFDYASPGRLTLCTTLLALNLPCCVASPRWLSYFVDEFVSLSHLLLSIVCVGTNPDADSLELVSAGQRRKLTETRASSSPSAYSFLSGCGISPYDLRPRCSVFALHRTVTQDKRPFSTIRYRVNLTLSG